MNIFGSFDSFSLFLPSPSSSFSLSHSRSFDLFHSAHFQSNARLHLHTIFLLTSSIFKIDRHYYKELKFLQLALKLFTRIFYFPQMVLEIFLTSLYNIVCAMCKCSLSICLLHSVYVSLFIYTKVVQCIKSMSKMGEKKTKHNQRRELCANVQIAQNLQ